VSPKLEKLIEKGLFERLPATFSTFFWQQIKEWDTLFPAERGYFERLFTLIDSLPALDADAMFEPLRATERKMGVNERNWPRRAFTLEQVDFLNRNPHYPEWRAAVANLFGRLDPILEEEVRRHGRPRLVIVRSPAELPVGPDRMWTRLKGKRVALDGEFDGAAHFAPLFASAKSGPFDSWVIEAGNSASVEGAVHLSYEGLEAYRKRLMTTVQHIVDKQQIRGPRELGAELKKIRILASEGDAAKDSVMAEFTRSVLLAGNGTLLINNTFVEWATVQALRRARPALLMASFGIRNKMKPFSSLLIYTDQEQANPIPTQMDTLGTYQDLEVFYLYIWQEGQKYAEYQNNTVYLFIAEGMDELLYTAPPDFVLPDRAKPEQVMAKALQWLHG